MTLLFADSILDKFFANTFNVTNNRITATALTNISDTALSLAHSALSVCALHCFHLPLQIFALCL